MHVQRLFPPLLLRVRNVLRCSAPVCQWLQTRGPRGLSCAGHAFTSSLCCCCTNASSSPAPSCTRTRAQLDDAIGKSTSHTAAAAACSCVCVQHKKNSMRPKQPRCKLQSCCTRRAVSYAAVVARERHGMAQACDAMPCAANCNTQSLCCNTI